MKLWCDQTWGYKGLFETIFGPFESNWWNAEFQAGSFLLFSFFRNRSLFSPFFPTLFPQKILLTILLLLPFFGPLSGSKRGTIFGPFESYWWNAEFQAGSFSFFSFSEIFPPFPSFSYLFPPKNITNNITTIIPSFPFFGLLSGSKRGANFRPFESYWWNAEFRPGSFLWFFPFSD